MNLAFSEEQTAVAGLARRIFEGSAPDALWRELAKAQLLGVGIDARFGGIGGGMLEAASLLEELGKAVPHIPLASHVVAGIAIAALGTPEQQREWLPKIAGGDAVFTIAFEQTPAPYAHLASGALVVEDGRVFLADPHGAVFERQTGTTGEPFAFMRLSEPREPLGGEDAATVLRQRAVVAACAVQAGIAARALQLTADHLKVREQFGRPLGTFQAVQQRMADSYIDAEAIRWTMWQAAWMLDEGLPAAAEVAVAKYWACEGGHRVLAAAQHLHGGLGVDSGYPLHRYTTAAKQIEMTLGTAPEQLAALGDLIAEER